MREVANHTALAVEVQLGITVALTKGLGGAHSAGSGAIELLDGRGWRALYIEVINGLAQRRRVHGVRLAMQQPRPVKLGKNGEDAAGAMHIFQMHGRRGGSDFAEVRHTAREAINVGHREGDFTFLSRGQQMQNSIR